MDRNMDSKEKVGSLISYRNVWVHGNSRVMSIPAKMARALGIGKGSPLKLAFDADAREIRVSVAR